MLKTPEFWYSDTQPPASLKPLSWVYDHVSRLQRQCTSTKKVSKPVICVGNITMGGSGKTPVAIALSHLMKDMGYLPHFLSRGYGGAEKGPVHVQEQEHQAQDVGDEPLLLSQHAPCWVSKSKTTGASAAIEGGAKTIIMDDGYQNQSLQKDISILVIDGVRGFGNGGVFPAGPLRETPRRALKRANAVVLLNVPKGNKTEWQTLLKSFEYKKPIFFAKTYTDMSLKDEIVVGFAGIGFPNKFYDSLVNAGARVRDFFPFADHYPYTQKDMHMLINSARRHKATLMTTEKDFVRLPKDTQEHVKTLPLSLQWDDLDAITAFLKEKVQKTE